MSKEAKVGLLLGLVFIVAIAIVLRGVHQESQDAINESEIVSNSSGNNDNNVADPARIKEMIHKLVQAKNKPAAVDVPLIVIDQSDNARPDHQQLIDRQRLPDNSFRQENNIRYKMDLPNRAGQNRTRPAVLPPPGRIDRAIKRVIDSREASKHKDSLKARQRARSYVVRDGDNLSKIALKVYGQKQGRLWANVVRIHQANRKIMPTMDNLSVGQKLMIPVLNMSTVKNVQPTTPVNKNKINRKRTPQSSKYMYYVVKDNDSLWKIAQNHLGDGNQYSRITQLNDKLLKDDDTIYPGMRLRLPRKNTNN